MSPAAEKVTEVPPPPSKAKDGKSAEPKAKEENKDDDLSEEDKQLKVNFKFAIITVSEDSTFVVN